MRTRLSAVSSTEGPVSLRVPPLAGGTRREPLHEFPQDVSTFNCPLWGNSRRFHEEIDIKGSRASQVSGFGVWGYGLRM